MEHHGPERTSIRGLFTNSTEPYEFSNNIMAEKDAKLQEIEDAENVDLPTEEEEFVSSVYLLEGKVFSISKESQETIKMLS